MAKKPLKQVMKEMQQCGFDPAVIQIAYANVKGDGDKVFDQIFRMQSQSNAYTVKPSNQQDEQAQLSKAIQMSINEAKGQKISLEPLNPQQRVRKSGVPVGLKNIGNTCYFNSLLQTYFQNANFVREILKYEIPERYCLSKEIIEKKSQQNFEFKRKLASCRLVENLKNLFAQMIGSDKKYIDPTPVLTSIVDDYGNQLPIGDQKDIGQFNLIFLSRIDEGLSELYKVQKMEIEGQKNDSADSPSKLKVIGGDEQNFSEGSGHSLLKHSSIKLTQSSIVTQQFIGKMSTSFHNDTLNFHKEEQQLFSLLFVNVKNKQLYQALEEVVISHIDDYRNDKGQVVGVEKRTWIQEAPKTLFFQIDRVVFDKQKATLQKINDTFDFPKQFYIDPFLNKNKDQALQIQKTVRHLRIQKQTYIEHLNQLQNYGNQKQSLLKTILNASQFLESQSNKMQIESNEKIFLDQPLSFPKLQSRISSEMIQTLRAYAEQIEQKQNEYKRRIEMIEQEIQKCYQSIRKEPYVLYSILIHEGSAQMGHYYSYIYDIETNIWRKYNDINISEESPEQVFKEAKGINATSAYYLVYVLKDVLVPNSDLHPVKNYAISNDQNYLKDGYSSFLSSQVRSKIIQENHQMYNQIEQYKMGSLATRVVDSYAKKFEVCNEAFRKNKIENKKNAPPLLINLPLYLKSKSEDQYKNALIAQSIKQYGPKQYNPTFQQILIKKMNNFNDHKKPKKFKSDEKHIIAFMEDIYRAIAGKLIFQALREESYGKVFGLMKQLQTQNQGSYFNWLSNLLSKILIVHLLMEADSQAISNPQESIKKLKLMVILLFRFINLDQEKVLTNNCFYWIAEISILFNEEKFKSVCEQINEMISHKSYKGQFDDELFLQKQTENAMSDIKGSVEIEDATWNISRNEDVYINTMLEARQSVKEKIQAANQLYRQMKKDNLPLQKAARDKTIYRKK